VIHLLHPQHMVCHEVIQILLQKNFTTEMNCFICWLVDTPTPYKLTINCIWSLVHNLFSIKIAPHMFESWFCNSGAKLNSNGTWLNCICNLNFRSLNDPKRLWLKNPYYMTWTHKLHGQLLQILWSPWIVRIL
jgi:hypothetical protein